MPRIAPNVRDAVIADCQVRRPDEACGVLVADATGHVIDAVPVENVWPVIGERGHRFAIDPLRQLQIEREAEAAGRSVAGFYHSHPTARAVPSEFDRGRAWPIYIYVIVGFSDGDDVEFRAWGLDESGAFVEHAVAVED